MTQKSSDRCAGTTEILACPFCRSSNMTKYGHYRFLGIIRQRWLCKLCGRITAFPLTFEATRNRQQSHIDDRPPQAGPS